MVTKNNTLDRLEKITTPLFAGIEIFTAFTIGLAAILILAHFMPEGPVKLGLMMMALTGIFIRAIKQLVQI